MQHAWQHSHEEAAKLRQPRLAYEATKQREHTKYYDAYDGQGAILSDYLSYVLVCLGVLSSIQHDKISS